MARRVQLDDGLTTEPALKAADSETRAVGSAQGPIAERVDPVEWWAQMTSVVDMMRDVQRAVGEDLEQGANRRGELAKLAATLEKDAKEKPLPELAHSVDTLRRAFAAAAGYVTASLAA